MPKYNFSKPSFYEPSDINTTTKRSFNFSSTPDLHDINNKKKFTLSERMVDPLNPVYNLPSHQPLEPVQSKYIPRESKEIETPRIKFGKRITNKIDDIEGATKSPRKVWNDHNIPDDIKYTPPKPNKYIKS